MGALNPLFLLAGLAVGIPIFLHLFQRHQTRRLSFPALRYLERTEKEHARRIRLRQLLLLLARVAVLLLVVGAGARLVFLGRGAAHPPTAIVLVVDNSMSSGRVVGERRVLDELVELAVAAVDEASDEDRFWVIRAGEPWLPAIPGGSVEARRALEATEPSDAAGDVSAALERAVGLLATSELPNREIHLLSDMQRTAFALPGEAPARDLPVVVWMRDEEDRERSNRALTRLVVGGGLPPLEGQRTELTVAASGSVGDSSRVPVRVIVDERIRGAASVLPGTETSVALPPAGGGWVLGYADADPDDLRADDRRFFAYRSRPAPSIAVEGTGGLFTDEALAVLTDAGRLRLSTPQNADLLISHDGAGLELAGAATALAIVPPADETVLPALNRRLADAGIAWRFEARTGMGTAELAGLDLPTPLQGVQVHDRYELVLAAEPGSPVHTLAEVAGAPWAVEGTSASGHRYLLLASPLDEEATTLPVSTGMLRFTDWLASDWAGAGGAGGELTAGTHLPAPAGATHVRFPGGSEVEIDGTRTVRGTGEAGFYTFLSGDSVVSVVALNPPVQESDLEPITIRELPAAVGENVVDVSDPDDWLRSVYRARQGPELWWPLLLAGLLLLLVESLMATTGRRGRSRTRPQHHPDAAEAAPGVG